MGRMVVRGKHYVLEVEFDSKLKLGGDIGKEI